jgi:small subunit ribosomal protein S8
MRHDLVSDVLNTITNAEKNGKNSCVFSASRIVKNILMVMQEEGYIGNFEFIDDGKSGKFSVELIGKVNKSKSIKPRFPVKKNEFEKWEARYLPAKGFGILIVSTPKGLMSQAKAIEKGLGGRLIGFVY